jgi:hypothetical protein
VIQCYSVLGIPSIRLPITMIARLKLLADKRNIPYRSLLKSFLTERLREKMQHKAGVDVSCARFLVGVSLHKADAPKEGIRVNGQCIVRQDLICRDPAGW